MSLNREAPVAAPAVLSAAFSACALAVGIALGAAGSLILRHTQEHLEITGGTACQANLQTRATPSGNLPTTVPGPSLPLASNAIAALPTCSEKAAIAWDDLRLTCAETRIALRIVRGYPFSSIAEELGSSNQSVRKAASRIYHKAGVATRQDFTAHMASIGPIDQLEEELL